MLGGFGANGNDTYLYRLKPGESTPVILQSGTNAGLFANVSGGGITTNTSYYASGNLYFFNANSVLSVTNGEPSGTFAISGFGTGAALYTGLLNNKMTFYANDDKLYSWDGTSAGSYQMVSDSLTGRHVSSVIQIGSRAYYLNEYGSSGIQTSDLTGANCFSIYPCDFFNRGSVVNNSYIDFASVTDGSFNSGSEPHIFNTTFKLFTATVSNDWNTAGNWFPAGVPAATDNVVIPALKTTQVPVISASAFCNNLTMANAALTINAGANLDINGYLAKYRGTINGAGSLTLKNTAKKIYGSPSAYPFTNNLFDVASVNINGVDVSFAQANQTFNSGVNIQPPNKILAPYTTLTFNKKPFITGYSSTSYIVTGNNISVNYNGAGSTTTADSLFTIPIGTSATSYTPITFTYKGDAGSFTVKLADSVNRGGTGSKLITSGILNKKWIIYAPVNGSLGIQLGWNNTADQLPGFNPNSCYISNYSSQWSRGNLRAATLSNGLYTAPKQNFTSDANTSYIVSSDENLSPILSNLTISAGTLSPAFGTANYNYNTALSNAFGSITITPTAASSTSTIKVNGVAVSSGSASQAIALNVGSNVITTIVTAADGTTTLSYTITVTRRPSTNAALAKFTLSKGTLSPAFAAATTSYTDMVTNGTASVTVTPTVADATATLTVNGTTVLSGHASAAIALSVGSNPITIVVTAQDGSTTDTYTVNVIRPSTNAKLTSLTINAGTLTPAFNTNTTSYTALVPYVQSSVRLTPAVAVAGATVKINGTTVGSGAASGFIALTVGANTITTVVTAQDGITTDSYTLTVTRAAPSTNDNLSAIALNKGTLTPAFASSTINYSAMESNGTGSITITPTTQVTTSTVTVNGVAVVSGHASGAITLVVGTNAIPIVVTAQDGATKKTYTVNVIRPSTNAKLASLTISNGTLSPVFNTNTTAYTDAVTNAIASVTVKPTVAVTGATVKVNGTTVASGAASGAVGLSVGSNTITTVVTAQDGVTTDTYTITVTRAASSENISDVEISVQTPTNKPLFDDDLLIVHQGISPNGDGVNDFLQIDNISNYPDNKLSVMNRNGQLVYEAKGYDNATKVFDGHSNKTGQMQLPGTYFYSLDYTVKGIVKHKTGFLVLKY